MWNFKKALYCIHEAALEEGSGKDSNLFKSMQHNNDNDDNDNNDNNDNSDNHNNINSFFHPLLQTHLT